MADTHKNGWCNTGFPPRKHANFPAIQVLIYELVFHSISYDPLLLVVILYDPCYYFWDESSMLGILVSKSVPYCWFQRKCKPLISCCWCVIIAVPLLVVGLKPGDPILWDSWLTCAYVNGVVQPTRSWSQPWFTNNRGLYPTMPTVDYSQFIRVSRISRIVGHSLTRII